MIEKINVSLKKKKDDNTNNKEKDIEIKMKEGAEVKKSGVYDIVDTDIPGLKIVVSSQGGYIVNLDYGRRFKLNKKTNKNELKQDKTRKHVNSLKEAIGLLNEAKEIRELRIKLGPEARIDINIKNKFTMKDVIEDYKKFGDYSYFSEDYKVHYDNYFNHILDYFADFSPNKITSIDIDNFYKYELEQGNIEKNKAKYRKGININSIRKYKTCLKSIWRFMIKYGGYGVTKNEAELSTIPKIDIIIDGRVKHVSKIPYHPVSLTLEQLNYTLNDALQNEFDRSIVLLIALGAIGGLRRGEIDTLEVGRIKHDEFMNISDEIFIEGNYDRNFYIEHNEFMMIDSAIQHVRGSEYIVKLPKGNKIRVVVIPEPLRDIIEYAMEQRHEIYSIIGKEITSNERVYLPIVNILQNKEVVPEKISRKWKEYQERRNKRMIKQGIEPFPVVRLHELRHTHANLLKNKVIQSEISFNMGHVIVGQNENTTSKVYFNDRIPFRDDIKEYFDNNIEIDWTKALRRKINEKDSKVQLNNNGQLIIGDYEKLKIRQNKKKWVLSESEAEEILNYHIGGIEKLEETGENKNNTEE